MNEERAIATWKEIWLRLFHYEHRNGPHPYFSLTTLRTKHAQELFETGCLFKLRVGRARRPVVMAWPSRVQAWVRLKVERGEL
ncbi:hypothetical protein GGQ74_001186 [Desulfobaculum xiamenense]|uniref:Uncharacterized protein n=1 Tax=Desulfobaculum xiamenense TaxID=995050 RepID=A0A846QFI3_9BACT|nr:hypothetical protein [Desulfobaculum xiamenense]NJB67546.1 hypothetical protein [Desulfobaculum xiamenense]